MAFKKAVRRQFNIIFSNLFNYLKLTIKYLIKHLLIKYYKNVISHHS